MGNGMITDLERIVFEKDIISPSHWRQQIFLVLSTKRMPDNQIISHFIKHCLTILTTIAFFTKL